ncbi:hypothetical protein [Aphanizomenon flos-aquae]|uniref:hypothetical protein n=1 Tax=Aphanizomenon flos-aquae TaxID=1176 RepID=UPI000AC5D91D|nr:hypothetical protein [Aphanizomenon flos-aquae]
MGISVGRSLVVVVCDRYWMLTMRKINVFYILQSVPFDTVNPLANGLYLAST